MVRGGGDGSDRAGAGDRRPDVELAEMIAVFLRRRQLAVDVAFDGRGGLDRAPSTNYDVVVLDRDLPGCMATDVCAEIAVAPLSRQRKSSGYSNHSSG